MTISNLDPRSSWHNLLLDPSYFHGRCNAASFVEWILPLGQSSRTFISCVISCPLHLVEMELWKSVPSRFWTFTHHFRGWQFTSALSRFFAPLRIIFVKWNERGKKSCEDMNFQCFPHFEGETKHEIILTYQPNHLWPLRSDIRTLLEVATTSGNPEAWRNGACGQISWKLLSLLAALNGDSFFGWWQRSLLKNRVTSHTKHKKNKWLDFIVKSKCVWILIGMIGRKPGFILISIHPFLEAVHRLWMGGPAIFGRWLTKHTVPYS